MANLIDQMNILKGLDDQSLGAELHSPSGAVPPYLVMSELSRRKDMRQRYAGQLAQQQPATTVLQDQLSGLAPPSGVAAGQGAPMAMPGGFGSSPAGQGAPMPVPTGIAAAPSAGPPTGYRHGGIVHYANGGYVGDSAYWLDPDQSVDDSVNLPSSVGVPSLNDSLSAVIPGNPSASGINVPSQGVDPSLLSQLPVDSATPVYAGTSAAAATPDQTVPAAPGMPPAQGYGDIVAAYQKQMAQAEHDREQAKWLGLMQAGLAIAGGQSPSALTNIGQGGQVGLTAYQDALKAANAKTGTALAGLTDIQRARLDQQNTQFSQGIQTSDLALKQQAAAAAADPNSPQNQSAIIKSINAVNAMPDGPDKDAAMAMIQPAAQQALNQKKDTAHTIAESVAAGNLDPTLTGQYSMKPLIEADLAINHPEIKLSQLQQDWTAAQRNVVAMNAPQQLALRQTIGQIAGQNGQPGMLDKLQEVADDWNGNGLPALNGANLIAAKNGAYGESGIEKATQFEAELSDVSPALARVFSGGNAPTDKALANAQAIFMADTSKSAFDKLITLARTNLNYRRAALDQAPAGNPNNHYNFSGSSPTGSTATAAPGVTPPAAVTNVPWKVISP